MNEDPESDQRQEALRVVRHRGALAEMVEVMSTQYGRAVIHRIISATGLFTDLMRSTVRDTAFALGRREVGLPIFAAIHEACPELYATMLREAQHRQITEDAQDAASA